MDVILASANQGKVREVRKIFADTPVLSGCRVLTLADIGFTADIEENGTTFEENALIKARAVADGKHIAIADDSGLEVDALGGAPGVFSARYAGGHGDDDANNRLLLENLKGVPLEKRTARYVAAIACVLPNGESFTVRGTCEGKILFAGEGEGGFGYDPFFYTEEYGKTMASITPEEKNAISHRGKALRLLADKLSQML
ncbi:MAG: XTP/dITP diphosphatase [Clostridia bacterium]|nr:XTP/dITP diphosphatase [Clostridia bacterium]